MKRQLSDVEKKEYSYLIGVLSSAVNDTPAPIPYEGINWNRLFDRSKVCGLNAAFANTVLTLPKEYLPNDDVIKILKENINAELLIDHAWGWEPSTIEIAKSYKPVNNSLSSSQVLHCPYNYFQAKTIIKEMAELLSLDMVEKNVVTDQIVMTIIYDIENLTNPDIKDKYFGPVVYDHYGRPMPKHSHGTLNIDHKTSSSTVLVKEFTKLYDRIVNPMSVSYTHLRAHET